MNATEGGFSSLLVFFEKWGGAHLRVYIVYLTTISQPKKKEMGENDEFATLGWFNNMLQVLNAALVLYCL